MSTRFRFVTMTLAIASFSALGLSCAETKPPATTVVAKRGPAPLPSARRDVSAVSQPTTSDVQISDEIRSKCGISDADAYFAFNSASVTTRDRNPLDLVAHCLISGPLKGRTLKLIGHADPRGTPDYNMALGQWRADSVELYLASRNMQKSKALTTSRGAMDATGNDEGTWQHDRRVDIVLGN